APARARPPPRASRSRATAPCSQPPALLLRLRPAALEHPCGTLARSGPRDLRLASCSCGYDPRPSSTRAELSRDPGLGICASLVETDGVGGGRARIEGRDALLDRFTGHRTARERVAIA